MDTHTLALIISLVCLLCLSAFFSACETAFSTLNRIRLKNLAARNNKRARLALKLLNIYDKLLSSVLVGNNLVNILSSALATMLFVGFFGPKGVSVATAVMTTLVLVFGEISPKTLAKESPENFAMRMAPLMYFFILLFTPLNFLASAWKKIIVRIFPARGNRTVTEDELLSFVEEVRQEGGINRQEEQMIRQAIEFDDLSAGEICTPRMDIAAVCESDAVEQINAKFAQTGFSRLPVFQGSIDNITGLILLKDFYHDVINNGKAPSSIFKPVVYVPQKIKISRLLKTMQQKRSHLAVVLDEFGGTLGIVTMEDIVEELVGEIWDEHDEVVESIVKNDDGSYRVTGNLSLPDLFAFFRAEEESGAAVAPDAASGVADEPEIPKVSIGSWVLENIGTLPKTGDEFSGLGLHVKVSKVSRHRVLEAIVRRVHIRNLTTD
jgi:CBS domain containing-hemolysin-like protein